MMTAKEKMIREAHMHALPYLRERKRMAAHYVIEKLYGPPLAANGVGATQIQAKLGDIEIPVTVEAGTYALLMREYGGG